MLKKWIVNLLKSRSFTNFILRQNHNFMGHIYYVKVDPKEITHISLIGENPNFSGPEAIYGAFTGCFDLLKRSFKNDFMYHTVEQLLEGEPWESTIYYKKLSRYKNKIEALKHIEKLSRLIKTLSEDGYLSQYELGRADHSQRIAKWEVPLHEIIIGMDRKGQLFRIKNGRHRLAVAQHIGIKKMPAILTCYHRDAKHLLPADRKKITKRAGSNLSERSPLKIKYFNEFR